MVMGVTEAFRMVCGMWGLYKKYAARRLDEKEMEQFTAEARDIYGRYRTPFAKEMVLAVANEIERNVKFFR